MFIAKVTGTVVATKKDPQLVGKKLLIISPLIGDSYSREHLRVAVDSVGAGIGEVVLVAQGSSARQVADALNAPIDATIVGIVDVMEINQQEAFYREGGWS